MTDILNRPINTDTFTPSAEPLNPVETAPLGAFAEFSDDNFTPENIIGAEAFYRQNALRLGTVVLNQQVEMYRMGRRLTAAELEAERQKERADYWHTKALEYNQQLGQVNDALFDAHTARHEARHKANNEVLEASHEATHDVLTGLLNLRGMQDALSTGTYGSFFLLADVDDMKGANETRSYASGDELLRVVTWILRDTVRGDIARVGGDEFAVLAKPRKPTIPQLAAAHYERSKGPILERLRSSVKEFVVDDKARYTRFQNLGVSFGTALWLPGKSFDELRGEAAEDMKREKEEQHAKFGAYRTPRETPEPTNHKIRYIPLSGSRRKAASTKPRKSRVS